MASVIILRPRLTFAVGLDEEAAEIGDQPVDFVRLGLPPGAHLRVERVRGLEAAKLDRRREAGGEVDADAPGPERVRQRLHFRQPRRGEDVGSGVHIVENRAVDPHRRIGACIVGIARLDPARQFLPIPQRLAGIAALHRPIEIVPMVEQPELELRRLGDVETVDRPPRLQQPQIGEGAVEQAALAGSGDEGRGVSVHPRRADDIAFLAGGQCAPGKQDRAVAVDARRDRLRTSQQSAEPPHQLPARRGDRRTVSLDDELGCCAQIHRTLRRLDRVVAQPQPVAVLGAGHPRSQRRQQEQQDEERLGHCPAHSTLLALPEEGNRRWT